MNTNWNREQTIVALYVYCLIPFNKANNSNAEIIEKANIINRSVNSLKMKVGNFGSLDPELTKRGITGLNGISHLDKEIWDEYHNKWDQLAIDAEKIIAKYKRLDFQESVIQSIDTPVVLPKETEKVRVIISRVNHQFFRRMVLSSYEERCCISGLTNTRLIEASHIVDWADNESERMNPCNGLCLSETLHKAYDVHLIGITPDLTVTVSDKMFASASMTERSQNLYDYLKQIDGIEILKPNRFLPNKDFLEVHYEAFKKAN